MPIKIGLGSWADAEYTGILYPKGLPANQRFAVYATRFNHVELNLTYHAIPRRDLVAGWVDQTPAGFTFDIKLHRDFSFGPAKAARDGELVGRMLASMEPILQAGKLGTFLLMLSPSFRPGKRSLEEVLPVMEKFHPHPLAVELRHSGWVEGEERATTLGFFREHGLVWVAVDMPVIEGSTLMPAVDEVTHPALAYLRLHGRNPNYLEAKSAAEGHDYAYNASELSQLADRVRQLAKHAQDVHVAVNNHAKDFAPRAALALRELLESSPGAADES